VIAKIRINAIAAGVRMYCIVEFGMLVCVGNVGLVSFEVFGVVGLWVGKELFDSVGCGVC